MEFFKTSTVEQVDNTIYEALGDRWYTTFEDPVALLRAESHAKTPWVVERIKKNNASIVLDVGCGAGFLSNALAKENFKVTGIDLSPMSLKVARDYDPTKSVTYILADAYQMPFADATFDAVTAMDFLEHVDDPQKVILEISRVLKPGGIFIFHTFNRNILSWFVIIKLVEWLIKNTPKNMHVIRLFIKPKELAKYCESAEMSVNEMTGIKPVFSSIPLKNYFTGVVPRGMRFELIRSLLLSYMGQAKKKNSEN